MKAEAIIIHQSSHQPRLQRYFFLLITLAAWVIWSLLWIPLITLLAWVLGLHNSYIELVLYKHGQGVRDLWILAAIAATSSSAGILWSLYNYVRYAKMTRRLERPRVVCDAMALVLKVQPSTAAKMRLDRQITLIFLDDDSVTHLPELVPPPPGQQFELPKAA